MKNSLKSFLFLILFFGWGCTAIDRPAMTSLEPIKSEGGYQYLKYIASTDAIYPEGDQKAEKIRLEWLVIWLTENGYQPDSYEIFSREVVLRKKGLVGDMHDIYYELRVPVRF